MNHINNNKTLDKSINIDVACSEYRGAPYPKFEKKSINESAFEDGLRFKECEAYVKNGCGFVWWLSQIDEDPTVAWEREVMRAFKANGLKSKSKIYVKFGSRDTDYVHDYVLTI